MSVTSLVELPNQPAAGLVQTVPLGGDGMTAPHSATQVDINLASDASGNYNRVTIELDPRYTSLISYIAVSVAGAAAAVANRLTIACGTFDQIHNVDNTGWAAVTGSTLAAKLWKPPAVLCGRSSIPTDGSLDYPYIDSYIPNTNGETHYLRTRIYNFDKRARELTPLPILLASLPR